LEIQQHASTGIIGMYYGPNYDTVGTGVVPPVSVSPPVSPSLDQLNDKESSESEEDDDDDDEDGWITPDNLHRAREQMGGATTVSAKDVTVGCLTTDFSMQVIFICLYPSICIVYHFLLRMSCYRWDYKCYH